MTEDKRKSVLLEADELIHGDRHDAYGEASEVFERYATGWSLIIGAPVTPEQVALCMVWLKLMRERNQHNRDNLKDAAGYLGLADEVIEKLGPRVLANGEEIDITWTGTKKESDEPKLQADGETRERGSGYVPVRTPPLDG